MELDLINSVMFCGITGLSHFKHATLLDTVNVQKLTLYKKY